MTGILQPVSADDEADCQPGDGQRRMSATMMFQSFECDLNPAGNIFCLLCRPEFWAAFFIHGRIYAATKRSAVLDNANGVGPQG
jgi:hypothetical protein